MEILWQLHKNATNYFEQILETTHHETIVVRPLTPISKTIQERRKKHAGLRWRSTDELIGDEPLDMKVQVLAVQQEFIYLSSVKTQDIVWKNCRKQWMIGMDGERKSQEPLCQREMIMMMTIVND